ncbi:MAG: Telomerase protein component 1 [Candelina mexicana]|nr:MAG: Telomerase protein component 1 [Candelina mexicana]
MSQTQVPYSESPSRYLQSQLISSFTVIATSGPSASYPQLAYRNPLESLVKFLDLKHSKDWAIWEFRAEGTGYPDSEVYNRIWHYPWPDHHPPPFALVPNIMASMRDWIKGGKGRVIVVHCKAGKGRSGTAACSYLISEEGWTAEKALQRFTERRMRTGFGAGVSIPSQLRWIDYVGRWTKQGKAYVERQVEILEVHVWSLRDGVKVAVEGFVDEGRTIKTFHVFSREERLIVDSNGQSSSIIGSIARANTEARISEPSSKHQLDRSYTGKAPDSAVSATAKDKSSPISPSGNDVSGADVIFRPASRIILPTNDINIDLERRNQAPLNYTFVTSLAHVWFNTFFEGRGADSGGEAASSGVFEIDWDKMDGIKGSSKKGTRALDRLAVVWKVVEDIGSKPPMVIHEPAPGETVKQSKAADWKGDKEQNPEKGKELGLRVETPVSRDVSRANSIRSESSPLSANDHDPAAGVRAHGRAGEDHIPHPPDSVLSPATVSEPSLIGSKNEQGTSPHTQDIPRNTTPENMPEGSALETRATKDVEDVSEKRFSDGKPKLESKTVKEHSFGHLKKGNLSDSS